ncbi:homoserine kinase [Marmoricola sp. URHB0036]|uniref:homoserine kinase n=1 Tax=Marmoricola sp. URHB0036 TaxID=1298863 RepID=UPI00040F9EAF|nr:homoserine kinase [Marmoricola sp. URHB0036]
MAFVDGPVTVEVPATSANLGPGYDCLGLALELSDTLVGEVLGSGLEVTVEGEGADVVRDESHLVVRAMRAAFELMGEQPPGLRLTCANRIPHSRGMGSSSAAIVGGIVLARALVADGAAMLDDQAALLLANRLEGHPDNVAPALLGGFVICGQAGEVVWAQQVPVDPSISAVVLVPPYGVRTDLARGLLPETVPHAEAAANAGRAALLVAALGGETTMLLRATEDFLHQRQREPAMPESIALLADLRSQGVPAVVSGAGPTVLALIAAGVTPDADEVDSLAPNGWQTSTQSVGGPGARVLI